MLHKLGIDLPFLPNRTKIKNYEKLCASNLHNNKNYFIHIKTLETGIESWTNTRKSTQSNGIQRRSWTEAN